MPPGGQAPRLTLTCRRGFLPVNGSQVVPGLGCFQRPSAGSGQRGPEGSAEQRTGARRYLWLGSRDTCRNPQKLATALLEGKGVSRGAVMVAAEGRGSSQSGGAGEPCSVAGRQESQRGAPLELCLGFLDITPGSLAASLQWTLTTAGLRPAARTGAQLAAWCGEGAPCGVW